MPARSWVTTLYALLNVVVAVVAFVIGTRLFKLSQPCQAGKEDTRVEIDTHDFRRTRRDLHRESGPFISVDPCQVFSESYQESRVKFRGAVNSLGLSFETLPVVPQIDYTIDIAVIPGREPGLVIHVAGVHGVEGFAGAAIQVAFLQYLRKELLNGEESKNGSSPVHWIVPADMPTVILVHAFNPFGMAEYRRANENNVDLNRNGLADEELQMLAVSHVNHKNYERLDSFFNPVSAPTFLYAYFGIWIQSVRILLTEGYYVVKAAMVAGQYYQEKGIFYGGSKAKEKSVLLVETWLRDFLDKHGRTTDNENAGSSGSTTGLTSPQIIPITWIDVHTGLGPSGVDTLLFNATSLTQPTRDIVGEVRHWFPNSGLSPLAQSDANNVSKGYEHTKGVLLDYYEKSLFANKGDDRRYQALMVLQEFGTVPGVLVGNALMLENAAYFSTKLTKEGKLTWAKRTTGRAFYPQSPEWRKSILDRGIKVLLQAMTRSAQAQQLQ